MRIKCQSDQSPHTDLSEETNVSRSQFDLHSLKKKNKMMGKQTVSCSLAHFDAPLSFLHGAFVVVLPQPVIITMHHLSVQDSFNLFTFSLDLRFSEADCCQESPGKVSPLACVKFQRHSVLVKHF